jgi:hypothetical protein
VQVLLRWLLPVIAVFALLGNAVNAFASAGTFGEAKCCCPDPHKCKCHDHEKPRPDDHIRRCVGDAEKVAPLLQAIVMPVIMEAEVVMSEHALEYVTIGASDRFASPPEKPPF